jgi:hypothetical protein
VRTSNGRSVIPSQEQTVIGALTLTAYTGHIVCFWLFRDVGKSMFPVLHPAADAYLAEERRAFPRQVVDEAAEFIIPAENLTMSCCVVNVSPGGAKIMCDAIPPSGTQITLVLSTGERFEGVTTRYGEGELGLKFNSCDVTR